MKTTDANIQGFQLPVEDEAFKVVGHHVDIAGLRAILGARPGLDQTLHLTQGQTAVQLRPLSIFNTHNPICNRVIYID